MKGVFVNWTKPYVERKRLRGHAFSVYRAQESDIYMTTDQEILFTILSVGYWKKFKPGCDDGRPSCSFWRAYAGR